MRRWLQERKGRGSEDRRCPRSNTMLVGPHLCGWGAWAEGVWGVG